MRLMMMCLGMLMSLENKFHLMTSLVVDTLDDDVPRKVYEGSKAQDEP